MSHTPVKILLIDDEAEFVSTLAERLEIRGMRTAVALDGDAGMRMVASERPQVVILDVMMPGIKGLDVLKSIREAHPGVQVILLTGQSSTKDGMEGMRLGAFDYMTKPFDIDTLLHKIAEAAAGQKPGASHA